MKKILYIVLPLFLSVGFSQKKKTDEPNPMKGVKTQTKLEYEYEEKFGDANWVVEEKYICKYDSNGHMVEDAKYDSDGSFEFKNILASDKKLKLTVIFKDRNNNTTKHDSFTPFYESVKKEAIKFDIPKDKRQAKFLCVLVYMRHSDDPTPIICQGEWCGEITTERQGENGFGYDPIFWVAEQNCSSAQLHADQKNTLSHRGKALKLLLAQLQNKIG